jgi:hypothetical protein
MPPAETAGRNRNSDADGKPPLDDRDQFTRNALIRAGMRKVKNGSSAGVVLIGSASGVVFIMIEDETGIANLLIWPAIPERFRRPRSARPCCVVPADCSARRVSFMSLLERLDDRLRTWRDRTGNAEPGGPHKLPFASAAKAPDYEPVNYHCEPQSSLNSVCLLVDVPRAAGFPNGFIPRRSA